MQHTAAVSTQHTDHEIEPGDRASTLPHSVCDTVSGAVLNTPDSGTFTVYAICTLSVYYVVVSTVTQMCTKFTTGISVPNTKVENIPHVLIQKAQSGSLVRANKEMTLPPSHGKVLGCTLSVFYPR